MNALFPRLIAVPLLLMGLASCAAPGTAASPAATTPAAAVPAAIAPAPTTARASIGWDTASAHVGQTLTVTGPVIGTHTTRDESHVVLNVGKDFPDPARFTVYFPTVKDAPPADKVYVGKTIAVTGEIVLFQNVPEIKAEAKDIVILK